VIADELGAQRQQVEAAQTTLTLAQAWYDRGLDPQLQLLDTQRSLYAAQQTLVATELAEATSRLNL
jgi:outer membrane protein TolC